MKIKLMKLLKKLGNNKFLNLFIFPLLLLLLIDIFYKANGIEVDGFTKYAYLDVFVSIFKYPISFLLGYLIVFSANLLLMAIFNNSKVSKIIIMVFVIIFMTVNDFKLQIMNIPIRTSDVFYLNPANGEMMVSFFDTVKGTWILKTIFKNVCLIVILIILILTDKKVHTKFKKVSSRIILGILAAILIIAPWINVKTPHDFYLKHVYFDDNQVMSDADIKNTYYKYGYLQGIHYIYIKDSVGIPDNYSQKEAKNILKNTKYKNDKSWGKPNVVFILSESLSDINKMENIKFDKDVLKNMRNFNKDGKDNTQFFSMLSPTYGGISVNAEFEILTGASLSYFNARYIPYNQLYDSENTKYLPNIITEFNNNGYFTEYLTPWSADSYRSGVVYTFFGTDDRLYGVNLKNQRKKGTYTSDEYMMDQIMEQLERKTKGPKFIMAATAQNHAPYVDYKYDKYDVSVESTDYNKYDTGIFKSYAQGMYDADQEFMRLYKELQDFKEPTIVVLFGDHLGYSSNKKGINIALTDGYFNTESEEINYLHQYTTPVAIVANYDIKIDNLEYINANYLGSYVLNKLDLKISDYFKFVNYNMNLFPVYNRSFIYEDNKIVKISDLNDKRKAKFKNIEEVQYYSFFDYEK